MSHYEKQIENWVNAGETNDHTTVALDEIAKISQESGLYDLTEEELNQSFEFWDKYVSEQVPNERLKEVMKKAEGLLHDPVNHPTHYTNHQSGIECIQVTEYMNFCLGNAVKYIWRAGIKSDNPVEDLQKAIWYINREIERIK